MIRFQEASPGWRLLVALGLALATAARASAAAETVAGEDGFALRSTDGDFTLRLRALLQTDARFRPGTGAGDDGFLVRRARVELTGALHDRFEYRLQPELAGKTPALLDASVRWRLSPAILLQTGKAKLPIGLERDQPREANLFNELGYPTALVPNRDVGVSVQGTPGDGPLSYFVGVFEGTADGASVAADPDGKVEGAARLFAAVGRVGVGVAGTWGERGGAPAGFRTVGQRTFFEWSDDVENDGIAWRIVPQVRWSAGPLGLLAEVARSSQDLRRGDGREEVAVAAWMAAVSWVLTGEDSSFRGVVPRRPVGSAAGGTGAWQVVVRGTGMEVDEAAFAGLADPTASARRATTLGVGAGGMLNRFVRLTLDWNRTWLDGGGLPDEHAVIGRTQVRF